MQFVALLLRCRHTVGLNWTAFGIEHVGFSDREILSNRRQLSASLRLTAWLRCRHRIGVNNVIGHNENRSSPYHREFVTRLKTQTHGDWTKASMDVTAPSSAGARTASSSAERSAPEQQRVEHPFTRDMYG